MEKSIYIAIHIKAWVPLRLRAFGPTFEVRQKQSIKKALTVYHTTFLNQVATERAKRIVLETCKVLDL